MERREGAASVANFFDGWALDGHAERMERGHSARALEALQSMSLEPGQRALDLGCGNGWASRWIYNRVQDKGGRVVGVDLATEMLVRARDASTGITGISYEAADFLNMPFQKESFDQVFSMEAIYYVHDVPAVLLEIGRVLKPGGEITLCMDYFAENPYCLGWPEMVGLPMQLFSDSGWKKLLQDAGFLEARTFRCFDARPIPDELSEKEAKELRHFREEIGSLTVQGVKAS